MNSKNGRNYLTKKDLTPSEICKIIRQCGDSGVSELKFGNLSLSFKAIKDDQTYNQTKDVLYRNSEASEENQTDLMDESVKEELEVVRKEEDLANMVLEDPAAYEEYMANGDLIDLGDKEDAQS